MDIQVILLLLLVGLAAGMLSGMVGVGGGIIIVPCLVLFLGFSQKLAQGTSLGILLLQKNIVVAAFWVSQNQPNPANGRTVVAWNSDAGFSGGLLVEIQAADGQVFTTVPVNNPGSRSVEIETASWPAGLYLYRLTDGAKTSVWKKMAVVR